MKYLIIPLALFILSCNPKAKNCSDFRTGTFKYQNPELSNWIIKREDSIQIEVDSLNNSTVVGDIKWLSNCEYVLTYKKASNYPHKNFAPGRQVQVQIIETSDNTYRFKAHDSLTSMDSWLVKLK